MAPSEILIKAFNRCSESNWAKNPDPKLGQRCVVTALPMKEGCSIAYKFFQQAAGLEEEESIIEWNDHPDRTYVEVRSTFEHAIELAINEESNS